MTEAEKFDVVIVGAGAAGLTAAVYTCRKNLSTLVTSVDFGGQTNLTNHIENYPGVDAMPGPQLMGKFKENAETFGAKVITGRVMKIEKQDKHFLLHQEDGKVFQARAAILCFGKVPRKLNIPGEKEFFGRGLSTCVTCDGPLFKKKTIAIIGGGNSAVEGALEMAEIAEKIYLVHRRDEFRADEITVAKLKDHPNIELVLNSIPVEITGEKLVDGLVVESNETKEKKKLEIHGVFSEIGSVGDLSSVKDLLKITDNNEIVIDDNCRTSCPGLFAAGDITTVPYKQTVISAGHGATAALSAYAYLTGGSTVDWDVK